MKNKKKSILGPLLFFIAAVLFGAYILIQFHHDYISIAGAGIVMMIAAYFLVDKIELIVHRKYDIDKEDLFEKFESHTQKMDERFNRIEKLQKAIYLASVNNKETIDDILRVIQSKLSYIDNSICDQEKDINNNIEVSNEGFQEKLFKELHELKELQTKGIELTLSQNNENIKERTNYSSETKTILNEINACLNTIEVNISQLFHLFNDRNNEHSNELSNESSNELSNETRSLESYETIIQMLKENIEIQERIFNRLRENDINN